MDVTLAVLLAIILGILALLGAAISKILADEFKAWSPWLVARIIAIAAMQMPESERERVREEWFGWVQDIPGDLGKLLTATGFLWGAAKIGGISALFSTFIRTWRYLDADVVLVAIFMVVLFGTYSNLILISFSLWVVGWQIGRALKRRTKRHR